MRVDVDPARGAQIVRITRPGGSNVLAEYDWETPIPASRGGSYGDGVLDWLSEYRGGWQELFPNAGLPCEVDGMPLPFHGEASSTFWEISSYTRTEAVLRVATRLPLVMVRRMVVHADMPVLRIEERARNVGDVPVAFAWGHHPAFAARPGMRVDVPGGPAFSEPDDGTPVAWDVVVPDGPLERLLYLPDRGAGWAALRDPVGGAGVGLAWDVETFPHVWLWHQLGGSGFPWYGRAASVAIEPQSSWPMDGLAAAIERGRHLTLAAGQERTTWVTVALFEGAERAVRSVSRSGAVELAPAG